MSLLEETVDDLNRKYASAFALWNGVLSQIQMFERNGDRRSSMGYIVCLATLQERETMVLPVTENDNLEILQPNSQFFNISSAAEREIGLDGLGHALKFTRLPKRQWVRSLSPGNCTLNPLLYKELFLVGRTVPKALLPSLAVVDGLLKGEYPSYHSAFEQVQKKLTVALSQTFALTLSVFKKNQILIQSLFGYVGEAKSDEIKVYHEPAYQELCDYALYSNANIKVELCHNQPVVNAPITNN